jgi:hypothetical protein
MSIHSMDLEMGWSLLNILKISIHHEPFTVDNGLHTGTKSLNLLDIQQPISSSAGDEEAQCVPKLVQC